MNEPTVSVALITRNRAEKLAVFLEHAAAIDTGRIWELVVVDNGSSDETSDLLSRASERFPAPVRVVQDDIPGVARARNVAWRAAAAPIVVFTNDDCYLPRDYVDLYAGAFEHDRRLGFVAGAVVPHDPGDSKLGNVCASRPCTSRLGCS